MPLPAPLEDVCSHAAFEAAVHVAAMVTMSESVPASGPSRSAFVPRDVVTRSSSCMISRSVCPERPRLALALHLGNRAPVQPFIESTADAAGPPFHSSKCGANDGIDLAPRFK